MATYLLTWNPRNYPWDTLKHQVLSMHAEGFSDDAWSCGVTHKPTIGDRFFLIRLGREPKGIMASGTIESPVFKDFHWDLGAALAGKTALYAHIRFDTLLDPELEPIFSRESLKRGIYKGMHWDAQSSGTHIPPKIASALESDWHGFVSEEKRRYVVPSIEAMEGLKTELTVYRGRRSRQLRDEALRRSRGVCQTCRKDYSKVLAGLGVRVLQVHHKNQLAVNDAPVLTRLADLAVLCANCHALVHADPRNALSVDRLKKLLASDRSQ